MKFPQLTFGPFTWRLGNPQPVNRNIVVTRASSKAQREANQTYRETHSKLARDEGLPDRWGRGHA